MKVVLAHRFFPPDTPACGRLFQSLFDHLSTCEIKCQVVTAEPAYVDSIEQTTQPNVVRFTLFFQKSESFLGKALSGVHFLTKLIFWGLRNLKKGDFIVISTIPPVLSGAAGLLLQKLKGAKLIYWCMDIHPEVAAGSYGLFVPALKAIDTLAVKHAHRVVVLSEEMRTTLEVTRNENKPLSNTVFIPCLTQLDQIPDKNYQAAQDDSISIVFAGNMGEFQALPPVIEGLKRSGRKDIRITFIGRGKMLSDLIKQVKEANLEQQVSFEGFMAGADLALRLANADYGLVSLSEGVSKYAFPSKFTSLLSQGIPIVAIADKTSDLASIVKDWNIGIATTQDPEKIAEALSDLSNSREHREAIRKQVSKCFDKKFSDTVIHQQWEALIEI